MTSRKEFQKGQKVFTYLTKITGDVDKNFSGKSRGKTQPTFKEKLMRDEEGEAAARMKK